MHHAGDFTDSRRRLKQGSLFDPEPLLHKVVVVRRGGMYFGQVWALTGYWVVGAFGGPEAALAAAHAFAAGDPVEPDPRGPKPANWFRRRSDSHRPLYPWVRKVKGWSTHQARPWLGPIGRGLNLGLYSFEAHGRFAEAEAGKVAAAFMNKWQGRRTVGSVVAELKRAGLVPTHVRVPPHQRKLRRLPEEPGANLFGERVTAERLARAREARHERREQDAADREQAILEGEPLDEISELLAM